ncbi:hypothetical protein [Actinokineospora inagensis]|uniref:hypothetical protein n=1 Tax=Actinokineospora inagensis TaxID=103730 RepID=UPI00040CE901|nr:hypothetical protein [Actinokineospora inagensis]
MTGFQIEIDMTQDTVTSLADGGYSLLGFKAVQSNNAGGAPLAWFNSADYATETVLSWQDKYEAFTTNSQIVPGGVIRATNHYPIDRGQTLQVDGNKGTGYVTQDGVPLAVSIHNTTTVPFTCGVSQSQPDGSMDPLCAFPLYGQHLDVIVPLERVLLLFTTAQVKTSSVIYKAYSQGLLIDLTAAPVRRVRFDINKGWAWDGGVWAQIVPPNADLAPLLVEGSSLQSTTPAPHRATVAA